MEKAPKSDAPDIDKKKYVLPPLHPAPTPLTQRNRYLVPADITVGKFVFEIRKHMKLSPEKAIFLFVNNTLPPTGMTAPPIYVSSSCC